MLCIQPPTHQSLFVSSISFLRLTFQSFVSVWRGFCLFPKWSCLSHRFWIEFSILCFTSLNVLNLEISSVLLISLESEVLPGTLLAAASCCSQGSYTLTFCEFCLPDSSSIGSLQDLWDGLWLLHREFPSSFRMSQRVTCLGPSGFQDEQVGKFEPQTHGVQGCG